HLKHSACIVLFSSQCQEPLLLPNFPRPASALIVSDLCTKSCIHFPFVFCCFRPYWPCWYLAGSPPWLRRMITAPGAILSIFLPAGRPLRLRWRKTAAVHTTCFGWMSLPVQLTPPEMVKPGPIR